MAKLFDEVLGGSGPGTAVWSALELWEDSLTEITAVEPNPAMTKMAQHLLAGEPRVGWEKKLPPVADGGADVVIASYVFSEMSGPGVRAKMVKRLWARSNGVLVIIEPGTPKGFQVIKSLRNVLLSAANKNQRRQVASLPSSEESTLLDATHHADDGAYVLAPCPHEQHCGMGEGSWCHFSQRHIRSRIQMHIKQASKSYEDEKFSYLVLARGHRPQMMVSEDPEICEEESLARQAALWPRVLREPIKRSGHVVLDL